MCIINLVAPIKQIETICFMFTLITIKILHDSFILDDLNNFLLEKLGQYIYIDVGAFCK